jgi:hypothetical protein
MFYSRLLGSKYYPFEGFKYTVSSASARDIGVLEMVSYLLDSEVGTKKSHSEKLDHETPSTKNEECKEDGDTLLTMIEVMPSLELPL